MRVAVFVLAALLALGTTIHAQTMPPGAGATPPGTQPPAPVDPAAAAKNALLDNYLRSWEGEMKKVQTLNAAIERLDKDPTFGTTTKHSGVAQYMKSGSGPSAMNLALLELRQVGKTDITEKFICTGTYLYQFLPAQKEIKAYEMPKPKPGQVSDSSFLGFLFGMQAAEARKRYNLTLAKEDKFYIYVDIVPRFPADRVDFAQARLVLNRDSYLPRQLWFKENNGKEVTWDLPRLQAGAALDRRVFDAPRVPAGWKLVPVSREVGASNPSGTPVSAPGSAPPPRVIRPNGR